MSDIYDPLAVLRDEFRATLEVQGVAELLEEEQLEELLDALMNDVDDHFGL